MPWNCESSEFIDKDYQNIAIGNWWIIKLKKLFMKSPKYRENNISWKGLKPASLIVWMIVLTDGIINLSMINISSENGRIKILVRLKFL